MAAHFLASAKAPRLNPFAFASDTNFRFALLIGMVVAANVYLSIWLGIAKQPDIFRCIEQAEKANPKPKLNLKEFLKDPGAFRNNPTIDPVVQCRALFQSRNIDLWKTTIGTVALMLGVAWAIYWLFPAWKIRQDKLVFLSTEDTPELVDHGLLDYLKGLRHEAGVTAPLAFLLDPRNKGSDAQTFGRLGMYCISLTHGLITLFLQGDFHKFRATVLHELAHLRNADVDKTYFAVALWRAFVIVSLPFLVLFAAVALGELELLVSAWGRLLSFLALALCVYLIRNGILRAREFYADVRVSVWEWDGLHRLLEEGCSHSKIKGWRALWQQQYHPAPAERLRVLQDTLLLFRLGFWDAVGVGVATAFGLLSMTHWLQSQPVPYMVWFFWPPLIFMSLAIIAVGLGVWRGTFAALMRGETPREAGRLGLGLALGFLVGEMLLSFFAFGFRYFASKAFGEPAPMLLLGLSHLLPAMLLAGILVLIFKWVELAATTWIPVNLRSHSPHWAYRIGLTLAGVSLALWFGPLLYLIDMFQTWLPLVSNIEESIAFAGFAGLFIFVSMSIKIPVVDICLLAFPLTAWFWRGRVTSAPISNWPFLEARPRQLILPPLPLRPGVALVLGLTGGLIFVVLLPFHIQVLPELVDPKVALGLGQIAAAALIQMGVAALVACWIKQLGLLHALFAAFVAGCVIAGALGFYKLDQVLFFPFPLVIYPGTLLALPTAFGVSVVANRIRRSLAGAILLQATYAVFEPVRRAFYSVYFGTVAPKKGEELELKKALRTAQQIAALFVTVGVMVAIIQVISNRLAEKEAVREFAQTARELISAKIARIENDGNDTRTTHERQAASNTPESLEWKPGQQQKASRRGEDPKEFFQRVSEIAKELEEKALINQKQIDAEFDLIGVETMLLPETLTTKIGIEDNRRKLKRLSDWAEREGMISRAHMKEWGERIGSVASGSKYGAKVLDGMAKKIRNRELLARQADACWKATLAAITKINHFMAARLGKVVVQDGQLVFNTQDEITYNKYVEEIHKQQQLEADLQQRYLQSLQQDLMNVSELAR